MRRLRAGLAAVAVALAGVGCGGGDGGSDGDVVVVVSAPLSTQPWVGRFMERGARLAVDEVNRAGGVSYAGARHRLDLLVLDNGGSPQTAAAHARTAVGRRAAALLIDGVGAEAVAAVTDPARLPVFVVFEGGEGFIDAARNPSLFRLAPANRPMSIRLADYLAERRPRLALLTDDSSYGRDGRAALRPAFARNELPLRADVVVPGSASDVTPQVRRARASGADTLVVWARAPVVAAAVRAARSAGWTAPVYTGPTGADPLVRQRLADHPAWVDGLTFVSFRITSEQGPEPFATYRAAYEDAYGPEPVGVDDVLMPPDWSMFPYDAVRLVAAALASSGGPGPGLLTALEGTVVTGANGDERGYSPTDREGVVPDDMYFARFDGLRFAPVDDDLLSENLPAVEQ